MPARELNYLILSLDHPETTKAEKCPTLIGNWISALGKEARRVSRANLEDMAEKGSSSMSGIDQFCRCGEMHQMLNKAVRDAMKGVKVPTRDTRKIVIWLMGCLLHSNAQRPGAIANATLEEYQASTMFTMGRDTYFSFFVAHHKTSTTGRAKVTMDKMLKEHLEKYATHLRPQLEVSSKLLFPNREGHSVDHLSRHVNRLAKELNISLPSTATETRHAAATAVAGSSQTERKAVATTMSHSQRTQEKYYMLNKGRKDAVEGYRILENIRREEGDIQSSSIRSFSAEDESTIRSYFSDHELCNKVPTIHECREFLIAHPLNWEAKQVREKMRTVLRGLRKKK